MKSHGLLLEDWQLHKSLLCDLITLNQKHKRVQQKNMKSYEGVSKGYFNLVPIPRAASLKKIQQKEQDSK
eukprot:305268-Ditylum_brightwellii.AAC.1